MTEEEYIKVTNHTKIKTALGLVKDVLSGDNYGISSKDNSELIRLLYRAEEGLYSSYKINQPPK